MEPRRHTTPDAAASQRAVSISPLASQVSFSKTPLPNEIVDLIIQECLLDVGQRRVILLACSLVSHQWRSIVIPYLFRSIDITSGVHGMIAYTKFLLDAPSIASQIRKVHIRRAPLIISVLITLLERLPSIRSLILRVKQVHAPLEPDGNWPRRDFALQTLDCDFSACSTSRISTFGAILSLFSDIKALTIRHDAPHPQANDVSGMVERQIAFAASTSVVSKTQVHGFSYKSGPRVIAFISPFLCSIDAVRNLTSLCYTIHGAIWHILNELTQLSKLLVVVGPTLQTLELRWEWPKTQDLPNQRHTLIEAARPGLSACKTLVKFELYGTLVKDDMMYLLAEPDDEIEDALLREGWALQAGLIALLPSGNLRRLRSTLLEERFYHPDIVHSPALSTMRSVCNRFTHLEEICLGFCDSEARRELWPCVFYEMRKFRRSISCCKHRAPTNTDLEDCHDTTCQEYLCKPSDPRQ